MLRVDPNRAILCGCDGDFPLPCKIAQMSRPQDAWFPFDLRIASKRRFSLRLNRTRVIPTAEFLAISGSAVKIAGGWRCAWVWCSQPALSFLRSCHSTVGGPKWTTLDLKWAKMDILVQFGPCWPRIACYRETISAIPPYCTLWGFWCLNMANCVRYPLALEVRYPPPPQKGYLSDTCAIPYENKANGCDTPLCDTILKGYCAISGGISHWAAEVWSREC